MHPLCMAAIFSLLKGSSAETPNTGLLFAVPLIKFSFLSFHFQISQVVESFNP